MLPGDAETGSTIVTRKFPWSGKGQRYNSFRSLESQAFDVIARLRSSRHFHFGEAFSKF